MCANSEDKKHHTFTWNIENFNLCTQKKGICLESPVFIAGCLDGTAWYLKLYPRGNNHSIGGTISCFLFRNEQDAEALEIECEYIIEIIGANGKSRILNKGARKFKKHHNLELSEYMPSDQLFNQDTYSSEDTLTIQCHLMRHLPKVTLVSGNVARTKIGAGKFSFKWIVNNLNSSDCSDILKIPYSKTSHLEITVQVPENDIKFKIRRVDNFSGLLSVICKLALLDVNGEERDSRRVVHLLEERGAFGNPSDTWEFPTFLKKSQLNAEKSKYLKNDSFSLKCVISISNGTISEAIAEKEYDSSAAEMSSVDAFTVLKDDLKRMYTTKIQADLQLHADSQIFHAHKSILCSRSPVFLAMFGHEGMIESQTGRIDISDLDAKTMNSLLEFIYTGTVEHLDCEKATKLLIAADKYQVFSLKEKCSEILASTLSDLNVCNVLVIADLVQHELLKSLAVNYIKTYSEKILQSEAWKLLIENNLKLATETICKVSSLLASDNNKMSTLGPETPYVGSAVSNVPAILKPLPEFKLREPSKEGFQFVFPSPGAPNFAFNDGKQQASSVFFKK